MRPTATRPTGRPEERFRTRPGFSPSSRRTVPDVTAPLVDQLSVQRNDLTLVVPGDSASSLLFQKVSTDNPPVGLRMPRFAPPLSESEIDLIREWIDQGALDN